MIFALDNTKLAHDMHPILVYYFYMPTYFNKKINKMIIAYLNMQINVVKWLPKYNTTIHLPTIYHYRESIILHEH